MAGAGIHLPVMVEEVVRYLDCGPGKTFVDATVGAGGHAEAILEASAPDGRLIGFDRDQGVLEHAGRTLEKYRGRFSLHHGSFSGIADELTAQGRIPADGLLLDLGISSWQVDQADRGFSFRMEAPLDMRMDRSRGKTAAELIRKTTEKELAELIKTYGEERRFRSIARAVKNAAAETPLLTTTGLAAAVEGVVGGRPPRGRRWIHPATRTFQALRIAVNEELKELEEVLGDLPRILTPGGRCCCLAYHSLEDRLVKVAFRDLARNKSGGAEGSAEVLTKKPLRPTAEEVRRNPRSRSARLRALRMGKEG